MKMQKIIYISMIQFMKNFRKQRKNAMKFEFNLAEEALVKYSLGISFLQEISDVQSKKLEIKPTVLNLKILITYRNIQ